MHDTYSTTLMYVIPSVLLSALESAVILEIVSFIFLLILSQYHFLLLRISSITHRKSTLYSFILWKLQVPRYLYQLLLLRSLIVLKSLWLTGEESF
jgi:hypothetical protein